MEIVYRKVSTQDRLPKEINTYFTGWKEIIIGSNYFNGKLFEDDENTDRYVQPDYWLEELPLSSLLPQQDEHPMGEDPRAEVKQERREESEAMRFGIFMRTAISKREIVCLDGINRDTIKVSTEELYQLFKQENK